MKSYLQSQRCGPAGAGNGKQPSKENVQPTSPPSSLKPYDYEEARTVLCLWRLNLSIDADRYAYQLDKFEQLVREDERKRCNQ